MSGTRSLLFDECDLHKCIENRRNDLDNKLNSINESELKNCNLDEIMDLWVRKYTIAPISIDEANICQLDPKGCNVNVIDYGEELNLSGYEFTIEIPFTGNAELFNCCPSTVQVHKPRAEVIGNSIIIKKKIPERSEEDVNQYFNMQIGYVKAYLEASRKYIDDYNHSLPEFIKSRLDIRRKRVLKGWDIADSLGFPIRRRSDAPNTYSIPIIPKKLEVKKMAAKESLNPEPMLDAKIYEEIIRIISSMTRVMERSPSTFMNMEEEDIRQHYLVQLNGHFEGQATGETFNSNGKTDILIRCEDRNIFIAECKYWNGPQSLTGAIDQILSYATWRDTKLAIILFNKNMNFTEVIDKMKVTTNSHSSFDKELPYIHESGYRCQLKRPDDPDRKMILTILAFDIPTTS